MQLSGLPRTLNPSLVVFGVYVLNDVGTCTKLSVFYSGQNMRLVYCNLNVGNVRKFL